MEFTKKIALSYCGCLIGILAYVPYDVRIQKFASFKIDDRHFRLWDMFYTRPAGNLYGQKILETKIDLQLIGFEIAILTVVFFVVYLLLKPKEKAVTK